MSKSSDWAAALCFSLCICGGLTAGVILVLRGHPWFALLAFLIGGSIRIKSDSRSEEVNDESTHNKRRRKD